MMGSGARMAQAVLEELEEIDYKDTKRSFRRSYTCTA